MAMVTHQVSAPDGTLLNIQAPDNASPDDLVKYAQDVAYPAYLKEQEAANKPATLTQGVGDVGISGARGFLSGVQTIADAFGADNPVSQKIQSVDAQLAEYLSAGARKDEKRQQEIMAEAKDKGYYENFKAGLEALSVAPAKTLSNAFGQAVPFVLGSVGAALAAPEEAVGAGIAGAVSLGTELGLGAATGLGATKEKIYGDVKQSLLDAKVPEDVAEKTAQDAQAYGGQNLDQIILGGLTGAGVMAVGPAGMLAKRITSRVLKTAAEEEGAGLLARTAEGGAKGAVTTGAQAAQTQIAGNVARQREGEEVPTMQGVAEAAIPATITGGILGGMTEGALGSKAHPVHEDLTAQDEALRNAVDVYNRDNTKQAEEPVQGPMLLLEDQTGKRQLQFAEDNRDKIPVLGTILDSDAPRDVKLSLIESNLKKSFEFVPNEPVIGSGPRSLPAPDVLTVKAHEAYNAALDSNAPLSDLSIQQGTQGFRIMSGQDRVITGPLRSARDANLVMEALRREHDIQQQADFENKNRDYEDQRKPLMTAALAAAAREVNTPFNPITFDQVANIDAGLAQKIQITRQREGAPNVTAPVTMEDLRIKYGATRDQLEQLAEIEKPVTRGGDTIHPAYEQEALGPRPLEPTPTARGQEYLDSLKLAKVTSPDEEAAGIKKQAVPENTLKPEEGEAPPAGFRLPSEKRPVREEYPTIPAEPKAPIPVRPSPEEAGKARALIEDRLNKIASGGDQGAKIKDAVREALDSGNFTTDQMVNAFKMADISARLLGKTNADPHLFEFLNRVGFEGSGTPVEVGGKRTAPSDAMRGLVQLSLDPRFQYAAKNTASHEAFHVLQDLFASHDKSAAKVINDAFKGATSIDEINPNLLRKLKQMKNPDTGASIYDSIKNDYPKNYLDKYSQPVKERELQAAVFGYLDHAIQAGQSASGIGSAFTRLMNYVRDFKERVGNMLRGQGFQNVEDVFRKTSAGEQQSGLGVSGERTPKILPSEIAEYTKANTEAVKQIAESGQGAATKAASDTFARGFGALKEFFDPLSRVSDIKSFLMLRNLMHGEITLSHELADGLNKRLAKASMDDSNAAFEFMTKANADPTKIKDANVRAAAIEAKEKIKELGQRLVDAGLLPESSFQNYVDRYLPRLYLYNELTNRGLKTPMAGKSRMEFLMARDESLSKEERDILGEIRDPAYLTYVALSRPARDLAMIDFLNKLVAFSPEKGQAPWVAADQFVEWRGRKVSPYMLKNMAQEMREHIAPEAGLRDKDQAAVIIKESYAMDQIADKAISDFKQAKIDLTNYSKMPEDKRYGPLAGAWVQKGIYNDLVGTFIPVGKENRPFIERIFGDEHSTINKIGSQWKLFKTTLNIPTQATNVISNVFALHTFGGVPLHKIPGYIMKSLSEMSANSKNWQEAKKFGITGGTMSSAELRGALDRLKQFNRKHSSETTPFSAFTMARILYGELTGKAGDLYQKSEVIFKFAKYLHGIEDEKLAPSEAVNSANDTLFDYSLVNRNIRYLRNTPLGLPFVTYYYKALPMFIKTAVEHPLRFAPYVALAYALPAGTMAALNMSQEELDAMRKSLPEYIRNNGSLHFLPYRDKNGNIAYADISGYFPWSSFTDPFVAMYRSGGNPMELAKGLGRLVTPSGPMIAAINAIGSGTDPLTNKPIMDPRDTPTNQAIDMFNYIANQAIPPMLNVDFRNPSQGGGAITKMYNSMFDNGTGKQKKGTPTPDMFESTMSLFGLRMMPEQADLQRALNIGYMQNEINRIKSFQSIIGKDQSLSVEQRQAKIKDLTDTILSKSKDLQQYVADTQAAVGAAQKLRENK